MGLTRHPAATVKNNHQVPTNVHIVSKWKLTNSNLSNFKRLIVLIGLLTIGFDLIAQTTSMKFVGQSGCVECHEEQARQWASSHHAQAMLPATKSNVQGGFDDTSLTYAGVQTSFHRKKGRYIVHTDSSNGKLEDYEVKYTIGIDPLQQYLVEFPGGRIQALSIAWDSRPIEQGGQRWFHLYPGEKVTYDDERHWTRPSQNWNSVCAECHSTGLEKNYDKVNKSFATTWSDINIACEACHGPGTDHVTWAKRKPGWKNLTANKGLTTLFDERKEVRWSIDRETGNAVRSKTRSSEKEIEICARCHSRRSPISNKYVHGEPLLDHYLPTLLHDDMYYADGQIKGEVYVYGSFVQSKMYHAGVTCSDCHEPHNLALRATNNSVCLQCHDKAKYNQSEHHFHKLYSKGASCTECHMPPRTYMVIDQRHDHSIRIPRPDLSVELGTPNACNNCHQDKSPEWAAKQVKAWYGRVPIGFQMYAQTLHAARYGEPDAGNALASLIRNPKTPEIARATALILLRPYLNPNTFDALTSGLNDESHSLLRVTALMTLANLPEDLRMLLALPMLQDPIRAVRIEAAQLLASIPNKSMSTDQQLLLDKALQEYITAQEANAERPEAQTNMGILYAARNQVERAASAYNTAIELNPIYVQAYVNLADMYRTQGDESKTEEVLRHAALMVPDSADIHHTLGLSLVRQQRKDEATKELRLASTLNPENARYSYVYAIALHSTGNTEQAVIVLQDALDVHQHNMDILKALVEMNRNLGNQPAARRYAEKLRAISP
jgi:predicted CXXCH cytochrome family protein